MYNKTDLKNKLESIHRKSYPAYKSLRGSYTFVTLCCLFDHVQGDLLRHRPPCMWNFRWQKRDFQRNILKEDIQKQR